jgi:glucuronate isomerase
MSLLVSLGVKMSLRDKLILNDDRLLPADPNVRCLARNLYQAVKDVPIISPHGHTDPLWYANDINFKNPTELFLIPDHYIFRMLYSQGVALEDLGIPRVDGGTVEADPRKIWRLFAEHYYLFRGTPSRLWFESVLVTLFGIEMRLSPETADDVYDCINSMLGKPEFSVRALYQKCNIEVISTTDSPLDSLEAHQQILDSDWDGRIIPCFRPDPVVDPEYCGFSENVERLGELTGEDTLTWRGYLKALVARREFFAKLGATATDHGHPTAATRNLDASDCEKLFFKAMKGLLTSAEAEDFRGQMLTEMVRMSLEDGLVTQIHPGSFRNHNNHIFKQCGLDKGADIPTSTEYVKALKPLLDCFGNEAKATVILFTLDSTTLSRELAPLAGHYPLLKLGPAWWFFDSPEGMRNYRRAVTETAGFYNTVGFNDDTRALLTIPVRHDMARRIDCSYLAELVCEHQLAEDEAFEVALDLAYKLAKKTYKL